MDVRKLVARWCLAVAFIVAFSSANELGQLVSLPTSYCGLSSKGIARIAQQNSDPVLGLRHLYARLGLRFNRSEPTIPTTVSSLQSVDYFLICDNAELGSLPTELGQLRNLHSLITYYSPVVTGIPTQLGNLTSLTKLVVYNGKGVKEVPSQLGLLSGLTLLGLEKFGQIETLPTEIYALPELRLLHLEKSRLRLIPPEVRNLQKLSRLRLWTIEGFEELATELGELKALKALQLNKMKLPSVPTQVGGLRQLEEFILFENPTLKELPSEVGKLAKLTFLSLSQAAISRLPDVFDSMTELREVWMNEMTNLRHIPPSLVRGKKKLELLALHRSAIQDLPEGLENLSTSLTNFDFGYAWPEPGQVEVNRIWKLERLTHLSVDGRHISKRSSGEVKRLFTVSSELGRLRELSHLGIEHAGITRLPESIGRLDKLKELYLYGNPNLDRLPATLKTLPALEKILGTYLFDCTCPLLDWLHPDLFATLDIESSKCSTSPDFESEYDGQDVGSVYLELNAQTNTNGAPCLAVENVTFTVDDDETSATVNWDYADEFYFDPGILQQWDGPGCYNCSNTDEFYGGMKNMQFSDIEIPNATLGFVLETSFAAQDPRVARWIDRVCCYGGTRSFTLENLYPFTTYNVKLRSANIRYTNHVYTVALGRNVWDLTARFGPWRQYKLATGEAIPWDPPRAIGFTEVREASFILTWQAPENANGVVTSYHVRINDEKISILNGKVRFLQVFDRQPAEAMNVSVRAATRLGLGPWGSIHVQTLASCPLGQYRLSKGRGVYFCEACPINTYRDSTVDGAACKSCPDNRPYTNATGTVSVQDCMAVRGSFFDANTGLTTVCDVDCMDCPQGTVTATIVVKDGCWRWGDETSLVEACPRREFCVASKKLESDSAWDKNVTVDGGDDLFTYVRYCKEGHSGLYCTTCLDGFGMGPDGCEACSTSVVKRHHDQFAWAIAGICLAAFACLLLLHVYIHYPFCKSKEKQEKRHQKRQRRRQKRSAEAEEEEKLRRMHRAYLRKFIFTEATTVFYKVLIGFFQVADAFVSVVSNNRVARQIVVAYNGDFSEISQGLSLINLHIDLDWVATGCWITLSHFEKLLFHCVVPIAFIFVMWLCYGCIRFFPTASKARVHRAWKVTLNATAGVILVLYPTRNLLILQSFQCRDVGGGRASVLQADLIIDCRSEEYESLQRLAFSMIVVWTVLPPVLIGYILTRYAKDTEALFSASYRPGCMLYEVVDMIRKLVQVCVVVAFAVPLEALMFSFLTCLLFIVLFAIIRPFAEAHDNYLAICAQAALLLVVLVEIVYLADFEGVEWWHIRSIMVATLVVVPMACTLFFLCIFSAKLREPIPTNQATTSNPKVVSDDTTRSAPPRKIVSEEEVSESKEEGDHLKEVSAKSDIADGLEEAKTDVYERSRPTQRECKVDHA